MNKKRERKYRGSLRLWTSLAILVISSLSALIIRYSLIVSYHALTIKQRQNDLMSQCLIISNHITDYGYLQNTNSELINGEITQLSGMYNGRVMVLDRNFKIITDTFNIDKGKTDISSQAIITYKTDKSYTKYNRKHRMIELGLPIHANVDENDAAVDEGGNNIEGMLFASISTDALEENINSLNNESYLLFILLFIILIIISILLSDTVLRPFRNIGRQLEKINNGDLNASLEKPCFKETKLITDNFNSLYTQMKTLDESRQEFVSNVSHELKTPMASVKVLADSLNAQEDVPVELYREFMADITEEIDRENRIITELLSLVKLDKKAGSIETAPVNINELIEKILKMLKPLADSKNVDIVFESFRPIVAEVDENKLSSAITNIVENAIKYNKEVGWVHVSVNSDHKYCYLKISDNGMGIPEEDLEHIFERFFRVDKSHSREIGGTGLGLAIAKNIINLHQGVINVTSVVDEGTSFDIRIPLTHNE